MPCYEVNLISVEFKAQNEGLLKAAAEGLGYTFSKWQNFIVLTNNQGNSIDISNGKANTRYGTQADINALKRAYSIEIIKQEAKTKGWSGNWADLKTKNTVTVRKF